MKALRWWLPGTIALTSILLLTVLPFMALLLAAEEMPFFSVLGNSYLQRVISFSLTQAFLSTVLSIGLAIPVARALSREQNFPARTWLINLFSLSLVLPSIVAVFGIVAVYGRNGWFNKLLTGIGLDAVSIYGLSGILIAHVFFNLPLATRVLLQSLDNIPGEHWRLASQLKMRTSAQFTLIEWPAIRNQLSALATLIFALCFTSFAVVMTLGGGPRATTIEVAIYQALRFDFDINTAVTLALIQLVLCCALMLLLTWSKQNGAIAFSYQRSKDIYRPMQSHRAMNWIIIVSASLFTLLPLFGLIVAAINPAVPKVLTHHRTLQAVGATLSVSITAAVLSLLMGFGLLSSTRHLRIRLNRPRTGQWVQMAGNIMLVIPPLVLGTGLFLLLRPIADVFSLALVLVILINSLMALPFVLRILDGPMMHSAIRHDRLIQSLGLSAWNRWRVLDWPVLRKPMGLCLAIASTLAAGDLGAIALFGSERVITLPLLLYQRMGSYRLYEAAVTAALLLIVCIILFVLMQRLVGGRPDA